MKIDGFYFSAVPAHIRYANKLDLGLIYADSPCVTAGVFTRSQVKAAPVLLDIERLEKNAKMQAVLVNSGNANACTGDAGMQAALTTGQLAADQLGIDPEKILLASTGVIGEQLNVEAFDANMEQLVTNLSAESFSDVAQAIMTTDTVPKIAKRTCTLGNSPVTLVGMAKGSGMIMPNMATMLSFVCTDASIAMAPLQEALRKSVDRTFNRITVDGDTSTNDMVVVMANGNAQNNEISSLADKDGESFATLLEEILKELALMIVTDGEGAGKTVTIRVEGTATDADAEVLARSVANSPLVKTAFFGEDANWGRICMALGKAGVEFNPHQVELYFDDVQMVAKGLGCGAEAESAATAILKKSKFTVTVKMGQGNGVAEIYTCDFSLDYVKINADYRS